MLRTNIDRTDEQLNTKAPFTYSCSMRIAGIEIPSCGFLSIKINVTQSAELPVRLSRVSSLDDSNGVVITFADSSNAVVGKAVLHAAVQTQSGYVTAFLRDANGVVRGHIACTQDMPGILLAAAQLSGGAAATAGGDFELLPQCCVCVPDNKCAAIAVTAEGTRKVLHSDVRIAQTTPMQTEYLGNTLRISRMDWFDQVPEITGGTIVLGKDGITTLEIDGTQYQCGGKHLILKAAQKSNIRVSADDAGLLIGGVKDER